MPHHRLQRLIAPVALALLVVAALPCPVRAQGESCCAAACGDAAESPCAQLAAIPCCEAPQVPVQAPSAPSLPLFAGFDLLTAPVLVVCPSPALRRPPPAALADHASIRDVVLQL